MRRTLFILAIALAIILAAVALLALLAAPPAALAATDRAEPSGSCSEAQAPRGRWYPKLRAQGRGAPALALWVGQQVATWTRPPTPLTTRSPNRSTFCATVVAFELTEVQPGLAVGRSGETVTVVANRARIAYRAVDGGRRLAADVPGLVVVNANWFTAAGSQGPVVADGVLSGSADTTERGQIVAIDPTCGTDGTELHHIWTGEHYRHEQCTVTAVSGISLIHKGLRADAYPGITLTSGYTNIARSHSFVGFNETSLIVVATTEMTASELADHALSFGALEGVMLDGGGSTQISTPTTSITAARSVPSFVILENRR